jgi:hypothetical protein
MVSSLGYDRYVKFAGFYNPSLVAKEEKNAQGLDFEWGI